MKLFIIIRHSRRLLSGTHLESDSDGSPPTNCGDDRPGTVVCTFSSFPTVVIGNPEHQRSIATAQTSLTPHTKANHPTSKHQKTPSWICRKDSHSIQLPNTHALGPRLREDDGEKSGSLRDHHKAIREKALVP
jgi:hypothetical protein